ncbi:MAG: tetratricopeptide repeat protein [Myxococcales bacterium]|nr:tetratricopeptide repeat protein [Myxococcales bacterium]
MRLLARSAAALALLGCLFASPVRAQESDVAHEEAASAFHAGQAAYEAGRFPEALTYFERAYELTHEPDLLYNIATVQDRLRRDADALASYRAYLEAVPDTEARANIEARIQVLEAAVAASQQAAPLPDPVVEPEPEPEPEVEPAPVVSNDPGVGPWVLVGVGAAAVIGGGVLLGITAADVSTVENASGVPWSEVEGAYDRVPILSTAGFVALGVGVALVGAGVGWFVAASGEGSEVAIGPGGIRWTHAF